MMDSNVNRERRQDRQRRLVEVGPPAGMAERRINIERRLFNLDIGGGATGQGESPRHAGTPLTANTP